MQRPLSRPLSLYWIGGFFHCNMLAMATENFEDETQIP